MPSLSQPCEIWFSESYGDNYIEGYGCEFEICEIWFQGTEIGSIQSHNHANLPEAWHCLWDRVCWHDFFGNPPGDQPTLEKAQEEVSMILARKSGCKLPEPEGEAGELDMSTLEDNFDTDDWR